MLLILAIAERTPDSHGNLQRSPSPSCISLIDIKRARCVSLVRRRVVVELPPELQRPGHDEVGILKRAMYGTRDAAACWEAEIARVLVEELKFAQGRTTLCIFYYEERNLRTTVHGDDFETLGLAPCLSWCAAQLRSRWIISERGILGPQAYPIRLSAFDIRVGLSLGHEKEILGNQTLAMSIWWFSLSVSRAPWLHPS